MKINLLGATVVSAVISLLASCQPQAEKKEYNQDHMLYSTIWYQHSPEMQALYYQAFNIAGERIRLQSVHKTTKPKAVVVDIDETMLDNSPFQAQEIIENREYSTEFWKEWTSLARAKALPGAVEFSKLCDSLKVTLFYITNRSADEAASTLKNLDSLGFAFAKPEYLLTKQNESSKKQRRERVAEHYDIMLLVGDNLNDFSEIFENRGDDWGSGMVDKHKRDFGTRFIILPNPMYGDWEKNIYHTRGLSPQQKDSLRHSLLRGFR